ncbi:MAG: phosphoglucosamine mutase [Planctomycetes bacterium]|nr:phosphoglucosamine mutase [Planctomycetota bacterium]
MNDVKEPACIFGTDGIRDRAGEGLLARDAVARIAGATIRALENLAPFGQDFPPARISAGARRILIGRDTRESGEEIEGLIAETFSRAGHPVTLLGVLPTPGVACLSARRPDALLGIMISASHNPAEYNGIKYLSPAGAKSSPAFEEKVSAFYWSGRGGFAAGGSEGASRDSGGRAPIEVDAGAAEEYIESLVRASREPRRFRSRRVAVDAANGAAARVASRVFERLGAEVMAIADRPDGRNINERCGSLHPQGLARRVVEERADFGFAFDGDGDRMIPVTEKGKVLDGDYTLAIAGRALHRAGSLPGKAVVATVMSNLGLEKALAKEGLKLIRTPVGDRHVYETMVAEKHPLGGEQSGHIIFLDDARTGDGILAAIRLVDCLAGDGAVSLEENSGILKQYPQVLLNYQVPRRVPLERLAEVEKAIARAEQALAGEGRVVVRYSGTEPLVRVMIEGPEQGAIERLAREIGAAVLESIK